MKVAAHAETTLPASADQLQAAPVRLNPGFRYLPGVAQQPVQTVRLTENGQLAACVREVGDRRSAFGVSLASGIATCHRNCSVITA